MFGSSNPPIPSEMSLHLFSLFTKIEQYQMRSVSKSWKEILEEDFYWKSTGADSFENFNKRIRFLDIRCKLLALSNIIDSLRQAEITMRWHLYLSELPHGFDQHMPLFTQMFISQEAALIIPINHHSYFHSLNGVLALCGGLISPQQAASMPSGEYITHLISDDGMNALRKKQLTPEIAASMPDTDTLAAHIKSLAESQINRVKHGF